MTVARSHPLTLIVWNPATNGKRSCEIDQCLHHATATANTAIAAAMTTAFIWRLPRGIMPPVPRRHAPPRRAQ